MNISAFCTVGGHSELVDMEDPSMLPPGWKRFKASAIAPPIGPTDPWSPAIWYQDDASGTVILCCPNHQPVKV